ncbi:histidine kinase [Flavobacterium sp.]|uniref:sensor histidine kinase n=1 Tax=Flavobacterium sp. TaxID=239 RepID=UPI00286DE088|nr:histidine kinase [Flavobacterium sp.]
MYTYYSLYVLILLLFIIAVYIKNTGDFPFPSHKRAMMQLLIEALQMLSTLSFCAFIYQAMLLQDIKYMKLQKLYQFYINFTIFYFLIMLLFPDFVRKSIPLFVVSRIIIYLISIVFYYHIAKNLHIVFFRYLFFAITALFVTGILAIIDSTVYQETSVYTGFQYLCYGYLLENICFIAAFIYKYFKIDNEIDEVARQHEIQLFNNKIEMQQQLFQQQLVLEQQRNKITADLHDEIGSSLSSLQINSAIANRLIKDNPNEAQRVLGKIEDQSQSIAEKIGDIIWSMKPGKEEFMTISTRIKNFANDILGATTIDYEIKIDTAIDEQIKDIMTRKNVVLITKEAINNAVKYSQASAVVVTFSIEQNTIFLEVKDNGLGFDATQIKGNGIANMQKRVTELKGSFNIFSNASTGTTISVSIPCN